MLGMSCCKTLGVVWLSAHHATANGVSRSGAVRKEKVAEVVVPLRTRYT